MIEKLILSNFQSHKNTVLDFHSGVNCVVGSSDVGKTAIIRALRWLIWNRPSGESFRSYWGGETTVSAYFERCTITRARDKSNVYILDDDTIFEAVRTDVPEAIIRVLNLNNINLQEQFDRPFLLDTSPGEVASHFNRIAHLDKIDSSNRSVQSWIRLLEQDITNGKKLLSEYEVALQDYANVDQLDSDVSEVEQLDLRRITVQGRVEMLRKILSGVESIRQELSLLEVVVDLEPSVNEVLLLIEKRNRTRLQQQSIQVILEQTKLVESDLDEQIAISSSEQEVTGLLDLIGVRSNLDRSKASLRELLGTLDSTMFDLEIEESNVSNMTDEFREQFPDVCPLCNQPIAKGKKR